MFAKAYELKNIETSNIDLDTCVEIPSWRYWHLVVPFSLGSEKLLLCFLMKSGYFIFRISPIFHFWSGNYFIFNGSMWQKS